MRGPTPPTIAIAADRRDPYKSKLERAYAERLELRRLAGEILDWRYEPMSLRLAEGLSYRPDFLILATDRVLELHETKGWHKNIRDSRTRWLMAAEAFPWFRWRFVTRRARQWQVETYGE